MGRPRSDAPQRLVATAGKLLRERGYHATGVKEIAASAGVPMGSVYFHFPGGKNEIVLAALSKSGDTVTGVIKQLVDGAPDTRGAVREYVKLATKMLRESEYRAGCPLATTVLEVAAEDDDVARTANASFTAWSRLLGSKLASDGYDAPEALAATILATIEGALLFARAARSTKPMRDIAAQLDALLATTSRNPVS